MLTLLGEWLEIILFRSGTVRSLYFVQAHVRIQFHMVLYNCSYIYFGTWACLGFQQIPPRSWDLLPLTWDGWETTAEQNCRSLQRSFRKNTTGNCMVYKKVGKGDSFWKLSLSGSILFHVASIWLGVVPYQFLCKVGSANSTIRKPVASSGGIRKTRKC